MMINDSVRAFNAPPGSDEDPYHDYRGLRNETSMTCEMIEEVLLLLVIR